MSKILKTKLIENLIEDVELHLSDTTKFFQNLSNEALLKPAENGGWSIAQCLEHLNSYSQYYLPQIKKGLENASKTENNFFESSWLGAYFTKMMRSSSTKKYKAFKNHIPDENLDSAVVLAEFIEYQETLLNCLKQAQNIDLERIKIPISLTKWVKLSLGDVFQFMIAHDERHIQQAKRNLSTFQNA